MNHYVESPDASLRVAILSNTYAPRLVGPSIAIDHLKTALIEEGSEVLVLAPEYRSFAAVRDHEKHVVRLRSFRQWGVQQWAMPLPYLSRFRIRQVLERFRPDVIHVHQPFILGLEGLRAARRFGVPVVYSFHTLYDHYTHYATRFGKKIAAEIIGRQSRRFLERVDHIVAPTRPIASYLHRQNVSTPISVIPTGVAADVFRFCRTARKRTRAKLGIADGRKMLLHVGRLAKEKRIDFLLEVLLRLTDKGDDYVLVVIGDGTQKAALRRLAARLGVHDRVIWLGLVGQQALPSYYSAADLFVFSSLSDTQAIVLYEALSAKLPIVAVDSLAAKAAVSRPQNGFLTDDDPREFSRAVREAASLLSDFAPELDGDVHRASSVSRYLHLYRNLIQVASPDGELPVGATESFM